jgi:hypothetical protein
MLEEQLAAIVGRFAVPETEQKRLLVAWRHRRPQTDALVDGERLRRMLRRNLFAEAIAENRTVVAVKPRPELLPFFKAVN